MEGRRYVPFRCLSRQPPGIPVPLQTPPILAVIRDQMDSELEECNHTVMENGLEGRVYFLVGRSNPCVP